MKRAVGPAVLVALAVSAAAACSGKSTTAGAVGPSPSLTKSTTTGSGDSTPSRAARSSAGMTPAKRPAPVESNPPGDIPDNIAYVLYRNTAGRYSFVHPEGWAAIARGATVTFTDKLNGVTVSGMPATVAPTVASANRALSSLRTTEPAFELRGVRPVALPGGAGVLIVFRRNSAPDQVTGKVFRDEVQRYVIYRGGREAVLDLYGAVGSDNVDPYTKISQSLRLS